MKCNMNHRTGSRGGNEHLKVLDAILYVAPYLSIRDICRLKTTCPAIDRVLSPSSLYEVNIPLSHHDHSAEVPLCVRLMKDAILRYPNIRCVMYD